MTAKHTSPAAPAGPGIDVEQAMAVIEKGQQLAGHFPSAETLDSARRILTGELSAEDADLELDAALARIVARERDTLACRACGTWICDDCSARRAYASRFSEQEQHCAKCAGTSGHMAPGTHRAGRAEDHDASYRRSMADEVPLRYPLR
jgi:hypothetical protein